MGGVLIDEKWVANDGLVNTVSALYPFGEPYQDYNPKKIACAFYLDLMHILERLPK